MACAAPIEPDDLTPQASLAHMPGQEHAASLVIDVVASRIEAANSAARLVLGLSPSVTLPAALDSAMPALQRLRQIAAGQPPTERETLTFWSKGRLATLTCTVKPVNANGLKHQMQLTQIDDAGLEPQAPIISPATNPDVPRTAADETLPPIKPRDDAETLREIARRIREGQKVYLNAGDGQSARIEDKQFSSEPKSRKSGDDAPKASSATRTSEDAPAPAEIAKLAHELKTPLSAIIAASEIMRDQRLGPMGNDLYLGYASDIHDSAHHALAVITDMLEAAASVSSRKIEPFDLNELTAATVSAMQPLAHARGLTLAHETDEGRLEITANPTAIRQILLNLLTNATKFTGSGGEVRAGTGYLPDGAIYLAVRDTGEGMDEDMLARAFFEQTGEMNRRPGGGYGLGLPMVRRLAEANRGTIEIDSAPGKGTVVLISFPTRP